MAYKEFIDNIIKTRGRHGCGDEYHEKHHIVPRCLGGEDKEENYIDLFAREHYEAHKLLALENPHESKLQYAWWMMAHVKDKNQDRYEVTAEEYEEARKIFSKIMKGREVLEITKRKISESKKGKSPSKETKQKISNSLKGRPLSEETKRKMSEALKGENNPMYGKNFVHTEEAKRKISKNLKGRHLSEETKQKISKARIGMCFTVETKRKMSASQKGKHHKEETKQKISKSLKGKHFSKEHRQNMGKAVKCVENNKEYYSALEAQRETGVNSTSICLCCTGKRKTAGGFHWRYATKEEIENMNKGDE